MESNNSQNYLIIPGFSYWINLQHFNYRKNLNNFIIFSCVHKMKKIVKNFLITPVISFHFKASNLKYKKVNGKWNLKQISFVNVLTMKVGFLIFLLNNVLESKFLMKRRWILMIIPWQLFPGELFFELSISWQWTKVFFAVMVVKLPVSGNVCFN